MSFLLFPVEVDDDARLGEQCGVLLLPQTNWRSPPQDETTRRKHENEVNAIVGEEGIIMIGSKTSHFIGRDAPLVGMMF